jgi:hypothetical protein
VWVVATAIMIAIAAARRRVRRTPVLPDRGEPK